MGPNTEETIHRPGRHLQCKDIVATTHTTVDSGANAKPGASGVVSC